MTTAAPEYTDLLSRLRAERREIDQGLAAMDSLIEIVRLHQPASGGAGLVCSSCVESQPLSQSAAPWPCPTIRAVTNNLGMRT